MMFDNLANVLMFLAVLLGLFCIYIVLSHLAASSDKSLAPWLLAGRSANPQRPDVRRMFVTMGTLLLLLPVLLFAWQRSMQSMFNNPKNWISTDSRAKQDFDLFATEFGELDTVIISWPACTVDDERLAEFAAEVSDPQDALRKDLCQAFFARVSTGYTLVRQLTAPPLSLSRSEAVDRLEGSLVGPDGITSCAAVELSRPGDDRRAEAIDLLIQIVRDVCDIEEKDLYLGGTPIDGVTIDRHSIASAQQFALPSNLIVILLCRVFLRSWRFTFIVFAVAIFGQLLGLALVDLCGYQMNAILIVMPPLILVLTVSAGVHLVNYYHDEVRSRSLAGAARRAMANGWFPCLLTAATSVFGLSSLLVSNTAPVQKFGGFASVCVVITVGSLFMLLPGAMQAWPVRSRLDVWGRPVWSRRLLERRLDEFASFVCRNHVATVAACLGLMLLAGYGLTRTQTSVNIRSLFLPNSRILSDYRWLEEHLGPMVPVEVVIRFPQDFPLSFLDRLAVVRNVQGEVGRIDSMGGTISAATFVPDVRHVLQRPVPGIPMSAGNVEDIRQRAQAMHFLYEDDSVESWRVSARVAALKDIDYGSFLQRIEDRVAPVIQETSLRCGATGITTTYTGAMPLAYDTQRVLLDDLFNSFLTALAMITLVMILYLRSLPAGVMVMLPNVFPTLLLFGLAGLRDVAIDIGSVMTASVALGIAVDDTVHFLVWFRKEYRTGCDRVEAIRRAYRHCAPAMVQTTLICGFGLLVYACSSFVPTRRFASMMITLLGAALVSDLLLLPALLAGPCGKWLRPRQMLPRATRHSEQPFPEHLISDAEAGEPQFRVGVMS